MIYLFSLIFVVPILIPSFIVNFLMTIYLRQFINFSFIRGYLLSSVLFIGFLIVLSISQNWQADGSDEGGSLWFPLSIYLIVMILIAIPHLICYIINKDKISFNKTKHCFIFGLLLPLFHIILSVMSVISYYCLTKLYYD